MTQSIRWDIRWDGQAQMYYYGARFYDPKIANFLGEDPFRVHPNPYAYVGWNPPRYIDPSGADFAETISSNFTAAFVVGVALAAGIGITAFAPGLALNAVGGVAGAVAASSISGATPGMVAGGFLAGFAVGPAAGAVVGAGAALFTSSALALTVASTAGAGGVGAAFSTAVTDFVGGHGISASSVAGNGLLGIGLSGLGAVLGVAIFADLGMAATGAELTSTTMNAIVDIGRNLGAAPEPFAGGGFGGAFGGSSLSSNFAGGGPGDFAPGGGLPGMGGGSGAGSGVGAAGGGSGTGGVGGGDGSSGGSGGSLGGIDGARVEYRAGAYNVPGFGFIGFGLFGDI